MSLQFSSFVAGFETDAYYQGPAGLMPGGGNPGFTVAALFFPLETSPDDNYIFANRDAVNNRGWAIGMRFQGGPLSLEPVLFVQVGDGTTMNETEIVLSEALSKLVHVFMTVEADFVAVLVNGTLVFAATLPAPAQPSGLAPTVGAREGGADPSRACPILGVGYAAFPSIADIAQTNLLDCRRDYDLADLFEFIGGGLSWTHWYTARRGAVVAGRSGTFSGPFVINFPLAADLWQPGAGNNVVPFDLEPRVPLVRTGGNPEQPITACQANLMWAPPDFEVIVPPP